MTAAVPLYWCNVKWSRKHSQHANFEIAKTMHVRPNNKNKNIFFLQTRLKTWIERKKNNPHTHIHTPKTRTKASSRSFFLQIFFIEFHCLHAYSCRIAAVSYCVLVGIVLEINFSLQNLWKQTTHCAHPYKKVAMCDCIQQINRNHTDDAVSTIAHDAQ